MLSRASTAVAERGTSAAARTKPRCVTGESHRTAQRNDLIESRATHLFIQCSSGCERDVAVKLAH